MSIEFVACGILILVAGTISIQRGSKVLWSPKPLLVVVPAFLIGAMPPRRLAGPPHGDWILSVLAAVPITVAYFVWSVGPLHTSGIPVRSIVLLFLVTLFTFLSFLFGWKYGVKYQGLIHTVALVIINCLLSVTSSVILAFHSKSPSYVSSFSFHGTLFLWLAWFAVPVLGDLEGWPDD
jgi:hypothetical protein